MVFENKYTLINIIEKEWNKKYIIIEYSLLTIGILCISLSKANILWFIFICNFEVCILKLNSCSIYHPLP